MDYGGEGLFVREGRNPCSHNLNQCSDPTPNSGDIWIVDISTLSSILDTDERFHEQSLLSFPSNSPRFNSSASGHTDEATQFYNDQTETKTGGVEHKIQRYIINFALMVRFMGFDRSYLLPFDHCSACFSHFEVASYGWHLFYSWRIPISYPLWHRGTGRNADSLARSVFSLTRSHSYRTSGSGLENSN